MTEEEIRKIINDTFSENIMNNLDSSIIFKYIEGLEKENQELKKQLEKKYEKVGSLTGELLYEENTKLINQQKEFIDWLENEIEDCKYGEENYADGDDMTYHNENELRKEILSKYKEIIGGK